MERHMLRHLPKELADDILADSDAFEVLADGRKVLKPGRSFRTPMRAMDAKTVIGDGSKNFAANRPGYRIPSASMHDSKQERDLALLYAQRDAATENAWREDFIGASEGDPCTCRGSDFPDDIGSPGHLELHEGRLICTPDNPSANDARSIKDARTRAYLEYDRDLTTAWQKPSAVADSGYRGSYNKAGQLVADPPARRDNRSLADKMKEHGANMQREYDAYDKRLSEAYKR
jgi:hypothetical protein